jgi:peptide/nickel transport system substrate-binding protein
MSRSHRQERRSPAEATIAVIVVLGVVLAGCGGGGGAAKSAATSIAAAFDPEGVIRLGADLTQQVHFDPTKSQTQGGELAYQALLYDQLLRPLPDGSFGPGLATKATVVDPQLIEVELRQGVVFSDGTPLDAEAVKFSIERNRDSKKPQFFPELQQVSAIDVVDPHRIRIRLATPVAGAFYASLAGLDTMIVSPAAAKNPAVDLDKTPVGAGPFLLEDFTSGSRLTLKKNPRYWDAANIRLAGIQYIHVLPGPQVINALAANQIDSAAITVNQVDAAKGASQVVTTATPENSLVYSPICKSTPPFNDARVRQALNYGLDRDAMNRLLAQGRGSPAWALLPETNRFFPKSLQAHYAYNPDKAKQLLSEAGFASGLAFDVLISPAPATVQAAEILQEEWAKIGVKITIKQSGNYIQEFYAQKRAPMTVVASVQPGIRHFLQWTGATIGNTCQYNDAQLNTIVDKMRALPPDSSAIGDLWAQAQKYVVADQALSIWGIYVPAFAASNPRVGAVEFISYPVASAPALNLFNVYIKKK